MIARLSADEIRLVVIGLSALIALNIAASFAFHLLDPETGKRMKEESAKDVLDNAVLEQIEKKAPQLAQAMTPAIVAEWEQDFTHRFGDMSSLGLGRIGNNGKQPVHSYNATVPYPTEQQLKDLDEAFFWPDGAPRNKPLDTEGNPGNSPRPFPDAD